MGSMRRYSQSQLRLSSLIARKRYLLWKRGFWVTPEPVPGLSVKSPVDAGEVYLGVELKLLCS